MNIPLYVVHYNDTQRRKRLCFRFGYFGISPIFIPVVNSSDNRLNEAPRHLKRDWSIMLQHLDCLQHFLNNSQMDYCIVCEDDIFISKDIVKSICDITTQFSHMSLDVLLLGYLLPYKIDMSTELHRHYFTEIGKCGSSTFHRYPDDLWGSQMYMVSRKYAQHLITKMTIDYAVQCQCQHQVEFNYSSDWIITKPDGIKRALINPMIAVEEGINNSEDPYQIKFHQDCYQCNFNFDEYF